MTTPEPEYRPGPSFDVARLPVLGNAELVLYLAILLLLAIITLASDAVDAGGFVTATTVLTVGYLLSRGIAKAGRVLEH